MDYRRYFDTYDDYVWAWAGDEEVLVVPGGPTIAYPALVYEVMEALQLRGLPQFGVLLMVLAATNPGGQEAIAAMETIAGRVFKSDFDSASPGFQNKGFELLRRLAGLPEKYRSGDGRKLMLQALFAEAHNRVGVKNSQWLLRYFEGGRSTIIQQNGGQPKKIFLRDFQVLQLLGEKFPSMQSVLKAMENLPALPEKPELPTEPTTGKEPEDWVEELIENPVTFEVGTLIRRIWSGLHIPYHHALPGTQPFGGVADLTNKGDYDRLLISEFANDDMVLLSRLANQEALYLLRETPPVNDTTGRIILIDVSLKNWGTPRALAYAVALAISRHPKTDIPCRVFAVGNGIYPLQLGSTDEIIESLRVIKPCLHAGEGLQAFFNTVPDAHTEELLFISSSEALRIPQFQNDWAAMQQLFRYVVHTATDGTLQLYQHTRNNRRLLQTMVVPAEELWAQKPRKRPGTVVPLPIEKEEPVSSKAQYPILFPVRNNIKCILDTRDGLEYVISSDKKLFALDRNHEDRGWKLVVDDLPRGSIQYELAIQESGKKLLCYDQGKRKLTLICLVTQERRTLDMPKLKQMFPLSFFEYEGNFCFIGTTQYVVVKWGETELEANVYKGFAEQGMKKACMEREQHLSAIRKRKFRDASVLRKIANVYISKQGYLVISNHELKLNMFGVLNMEYIMPPKDVDARQQEDRNAFVFADGSKVVFNTGGMLTLRSSDPGLPSIYVPAVTSNHIAIAASTGFAGNHYYNPAPGNHLPDPAEITLQFYKETVDRFIQVILKYAGKNTTPSY
jgi:hypothetical protein